MAKQNAATRLHAIATELGCDPELVAAVRAELGLRRWDDVRHAVQERLSQTSAPANDETVEPTESNETVASSDATKKERKASLTLSQRRALLRLLDDAAIAPASAFKALPYEHLVKVGYADRADNDGVGSFTLTAAGRERAESINPGYRVWSAGETVVEDPTRPTAGTKKVVLAGKLV